MAVAVAGWGRWGGGAGEGMTAIQATCSCSPFSPLLSSCGALRPRGASALKETADLPSSPLLSPQALARPWIKQPQHSRSASLCLSWSQPVASWLRLQGHWRQGYGAGERAWARGAGLPALTTLTTSGLGLLTRSDCHRGQAVWLVPGTLLIVGKLPAPLRPVSASAPWSWDDSPASWADVRVKGENG